MLNNHINSTAINLKSNNIHLAVQNLDAAIQSNPQVSILYSNKAILSFANHNYQQVQTNLEISKKISPLNYLAYYNQFVAYYKLNHKKQAYQSLLLSVAVLYIKKAISQNSAQTLNKALSICKLTPQNFQNISQQIKLSLKVQKPNELCTLKDQQLNKCLKQLLQEFKNLLRVEKSKKLQQKIMIKGKIQCGVILSMQKAEFNAKDQLKKLSQLKKQKIKNFSKENEIQYKAEKDKLLIQQGNTSQVNNLSNDNILHLQSTIKPDQNNKISPKKKENIHDDSFDFNQMSLNIKKSNKQQINNSQNNISSTSYKKNKGKKKQDIYPNNNKNQQIQVKIVMAQITNNKQLIGSMDPYCILQYNGQSKKTSVIKGGGVNPRWNQFFKFKLTQNRSELSIKVYDRERFKFKDDFIGQARFVVQKNGFVKLPIFQHQSSAGFIFISIDSK